MSWEKQLRAALVLVAGVAIALMALGIVLVLGAGLVRLGAPAALGPKALSRAEIALLASAVVAAAGAFTLSLLLGRLLARTLGRRLTPLIVWSRNLGRPEGDRELPVHVADEFGELAYALSEAHRRLRANTRERELFLAAVAHDLRTPLTALQGQLEGMVDGVLAVDAERLARLQTDVGRLIRLVNDLLLLYRAGAGVLPLDRLDRRATDLVGFTRQVAERLSIMAEHRGIALQLHCPEAAVAAIDPDRMDRVLTNVVANALTYSPSGSRVDISLAMTSKAVEWVVADNGPGIPPELLGRVAEPLVRGDGARAPGHVGMGLAIAKSWVTAHGGRLTIVSSSAGTSVRIRLPVDDGGDPVVRPLPS